MDGRDSSTQSLHTKYGTQQVSNGNPCLPAIKALFRSKVQNSKRFVNRLHDVLNVVEKNRITQIDGKSRDESNESNLVVIRH